jgi:hypothetical protein
VLIGWYVFDAPLTRAERSLVGRWSYSASRHAPDDTLAVWELQPNRTLVLRFCDRASGACIREGWGRWRIENGELVFRLPLLPGEAKINSPIARALGLGEWADADRGPIRLDGDELCFEVRSVYGRLIPEADRKRLTLRRYNGD